jgi:dihydropteroate synthase
MVEIVGVINMSPESFYSRSICKSVEEALQRAERMVEEGADVIDVGGMSTAPYKRTWISEEEELRRVLPVVKELTALDVPISIDTMRGKVAEKALNAGASIVNAVRLNEDIIEVVADFDASVIIVAREIPWNAKSIVSSVVESLRRDVERCLCKGISDIIIDPAVGFWRNGDVEWYVRDACILANVGKIKEAVGKPIMVGVSRKSFIRAILGLDNPEDRLIGSVAAEAIAVAMGADYIRTHNVAESLQAAKLAEFVRDRFESL